MRVAIYGTGGAGGYFGAHLARTGEDVTFVARGQHLKAIQAHGLCVETPVGEIVIHPAKAADDPMQVGPVEAIFVGVKAWQVEEAARNMQPMVGPQTLVVPLQNGVEAPSQLGAILGPGRTCWAAFAEQSAGWWLRAGSAILEPQISLSSENWITDAASVQRDCVKRLRKPV